MTTDHNSASSLYYIYMHYIHGTHIKSIHYLLFFSNGRTLYYTTSLYYNYIMDDDGSCKTNYDEYHVNKIFWTV